MRVLVPLAGLILFALAGNAAAQMATQIDGPMPAPPAPIRGVVEGPLPAGAVILDLPFDYDWWYGCSPTAAGMLFGWWDEHGYPDVFPGDHRDWALGRGCPDFNPAHFLDAHGVVATWVHHQAGQDLGLKYGSYSGHTPACLADFMLTENGGTYRSNMAWGFSNFAAYDDPATPECESAAFDYETFSVSHGWRYEDYCAEIDAGRPVHLGLTWYEGGGHSVLGVGYNNTGGRRDFYLRTTWNSGLVQWPWTDAAGWTVYGGTVMRPSPDPQPELSGYFAITHERTGNLRVWIGAGDPSAPDWETQVWNRQGDDNVNLVLTDIDLAGGRDHLEGQWYLKATDSGSGSTGYIEDFQVRLNGERWFAEPVHIAIAPGRTAYAFLEAESEPEIATAPESWFVPGWVWFSIPLTPAGSADGSDVLGFDCTNRLYAWNDAAKVLLLYPDDFTGLTVGPGYLARLAIGEAYVPAYEGRRPDIPFSWTLPAAGWCWVGVPGTQPIWGLDLAVTKDGATRSAEQDRTALDPWLNWNWLFWDPVVQTAGIMDPFGAGDDEWLHPWWGYRVWSYTEDVTIVFP